jgi:hypothetical protein
MEREQFFLSNDLIRSSNRMKVFSEYRGYNIVNGQISAWESKVVLVAQSSIFLTFSYETTNFE